MSSSGKPLAKKSNKKRKSESISVANKKHKSEIPAGGNKKWGTDNVKNKTPYDIWNDQFNNYMEVNGFLGSILIKGIEKDENHETDEEGEEEEEDTSKYTKEQMESLRFIMVTKNREKQLDIMRKLVLGHQANDSFLMFNTSFSYRILYSLNTLRRKLARAKSPSAKFDMLFAYTNQVKEHNYWMHDNEGGMNVFTRGLALIWKRLLKNSDQDLGIDTEYTKPAIMAMLEKFREQVEDPDACWGNMKFKYN